MQCIVFLCNSIIKIRGFAVTSKVHVLYEESASLLIEIRVSCQLRSCLAGRNYNAGKIPNHYLMNPEVSLFIIAILLVGCWWCTLGLTVLNSSVASQPEIVVIIFMY